MTHDEPGSTSPISGTSADLHYVLLLGDAGNCLQGAGQHLEALAEIFGCPHAEFAQLSQRRYGVIFQDENPDLVLANYIREVQAESSMASSCQRVG